jgi:hypothetical protein
MQGIIFVIPQASICTIYASAPVLDDVRAQVRWKLQPWKGFGLPSIVLPGLKPSEKRSKSLFGSPCVCHEYTSTYYLA